MTCAPSNKSHRWAQCQTCSNHRTNWRCGRRFRGLDPGGTQRGSTESQWLFINNSNNNNSKRQEVSNETTGPKVTCDESEFILTATLARQTCSHPFVPVTLLVNSEMKLLCFYVMNLVVHHRDPCEHWCVTLYDVLISIMVSLSVIWGDFRQRFSLRPQVFYEMFG